MGSYVESDDPHWKGIRGAEQYRAEMDERGYNVGLVGRGVYKQTLLIHRQCGAYIADPDTHDVRCPPDSPSE